MNKPITLYTRLPSGRYREAHLNEVRDALSAAKVEHLSAKLHGKTIQTAIDSIDTLVDAYGERTYEVFGAMWLTNRHTVICIEELFNGTVDGTSVYPREVVKRALTLNAVAVIFFHNHPSGNPEPSGADRMITERLCEALGTVDIRVLDHIVIGDREGVSMQARRMMP